MAFDLFKKKTGLIELSEIEKNMMYKPGMSSNSFYIMGQFRVNGHPAEYFYSFTIYETLSGEPMCVTYFALHDGTDQKNIQDVQVFDKDNIRLGTNELLIRTPRSELSGNMRSMSFYVKFDDVSMNLTMKPEFKAVSMNSSPVKCDLAQDLFQFDIPYCKTSGMISTFKNIYDINGSCMFGHEWRKKLTKSSKHVKKRDKAKGEAELELPVFMEIKARLSNGKSLSIYVTEENGQEFVWATGLEFYGDLIYFKTDGLLAQVNYFLAEAEEARIEKIEEETRQRNEEEERKMTETGILRAEENTRQYRARMDVAERRRVEALELMRKQENPQAYNEKMKKQSEAEEKAIRKAKEAGAESPEERGLTAILRNTGILRLGDQKRIMPVIKGESGNAIFDLYLDLHEIDTTLRIQFTPERHDAMLPNYGQFEHFEGITTVKGEVGGDPIEGFCYINIID